MRREKRGHCFKVIASVKGGRVAAFRVSVDCVYGGWLAAHETARTENRDGEGQWAVGEFGFYNLYWVCFFVRSVRFIRLQIPGIKIQPKFFSFF